MRIKADVFYFHFLKEKKSGVQALKNMLLKKKFKIFEKFSKKVFYFIFQEHIYERLYDTFPPKFHKLNTSALIRILKHKEILKTRFCSSTHDK